MFVRSLLRLLPVILLVTACNGFIPFWESGGTSSIELPEAGPPPSATPQQKLPQEGEASSVPTSTAERPAVQTPSPSPVLAVEDVETPESFFNPAANFHDFRPYQTGLRPEFASEALELLATATQYHIWLELIPGETPSLLGREQVLFTNNESKDLDKIVFRLYPNLPSFGGRMTVEKVTVGGVPIDTSLTAEGSALELRLGKPLIPGQQINITIDFDVDIPTDNSHGYGVFAQVDGVYALAGFYPTIPVYDDEGWNVELGPAYGDTSFTDTAFYQIEIVVPDDIVVVSSGSILNTIEHGDGTKTVHAAGGPLRDFYLAMSADYKVVSQKVGQTQVNSYYLKGMEDGGAEALGFAADALQVFSRKFGPYPYVEFDLVPTHTTAGGIEYPGVIVAAQGLYETEEEFFEVVVAHETAHQWWYGLVGNDQLDEPWLDEALTNYSMYVYFEETASNERASEIRDRYFEGPYNILLEGARDRSVAGPVSGFDVSEYSGVVYGKGPLFFDAVRTQLGDEKFFAGLQSYLAEHQYRVAYPQDLVEAFETTSGQQIDALYDYWIVGEVEPDP